MPPLLSASWRNLVMLNYEVDPAVLAPFVPRGTTLDDRDGRHYVSIVGFQFLDARLRGFRAPFHQAFDEVNLRFYVRREVGDEVRRGVVFITEVVSKRMVAAIANLVYHETYVRVPMRSSIQTPGRVEYGWRHGGRWHSVGATVAGEPRLPAPGSLTEFIAEHYWGYTQRRDGATNEFRVEHRPWRVWPATDAWLDVGEFYCAELTPILSRTPVSAFVADGSPVIARSIWRLPRDEVRNGNSISSAHVEAVG